MLTNPCRTVGLDVTWRCNWNCTHCYYRHNDNLHTNQDVPLEQLLAKVDKGKAGGLRNVVLEGWGEPMLYPQLMGLLLACRERGMKTSIITNGAVKLDMYKKCYLEWGLDHLLISSHGQGEVLDNIAERREAFNKQLRLKQWLHDEGLPFRTNFVLMESNYRNCPDTVKQDVELGSFHVNLIGFQAHYEWSNAAASKGESYTVAVDPAKLRPYIEQAGEIAVEAGRLFTIRYHPMCHLSPKWWPHIVNAKYVFFDPWEWNYSLQCLDIEQLKMASFRMGASVAGRQECNNCIALRHCGGWNRNTALVSHAELLPIVTPPQEYQSVWWEDGGLHTLNPANSYDGVVPRSVPDSRRPEEALTVPPLGAG
jgi:MoaA/NifB/PqqE/SkfB family radical SAM enzyme